MEWQIQLFNSVPLEVSIILWIVFLVLKFDMVALHVHPPCGFRENHDVLKMIMVVFQLHCN